METKKNNRILLIFAACVLAVLLLIAYFSKEEEFVYSDHLTEVAVTVTGDGSEMVLTLGDLGYYVMTSEENVNTLAEIYNESNTGQFWNIYTNHTFIRTKAKEIALDTAVRDAVYVMEAQKAGMTLTEEEEAAAVARTREIVDGLSFKQYSVTQYTEETLLPVMERIFLASKYANDVVEHWDVYGEGYTQAAKVAVEIEGEYYEDLAQGYTVKTTAVWDRVVLGNLTVQEMVDNSTVFTLENIKQRFALDGNS